MEIKITKEPVEYSAALNEMEERHGEILAGTKPELIWFLEHEDVYTAGISAREEDLIDAGNVPVFQTKRGGKFTYHGRGQLICYAVCNLKKRAEGLPDVRCYVDCLEDVIINTLQTFGIKGEKRQDRIGVWVETQNGEQKIAAIGVKFSKGITMHGFALNICPDLTKFSGIIPCGIANYGVCSVKSLGVSVDFEEIKQEVLKNIKLAEAQNFYQKQCKSS